MKTFILLAGILISTYGNTLIKEYPSNFNDALIYKQEIEKELSFNDIEKAFYISIIFPELMRYNLISDKLETWSNKLKSGYLKEYEGYSIGHCQIKPKFAKEIEEYLKKDRKLKKKYSFLLDYDINKDANIQRIERLCSYKYESLYIQAFVDICINKYDIKMDNIEEALLYISAVYNCGFFDELKDYEYALSQDQFSINKLSNKKWNYSKLSIYFYSIFKEK